MKHSFQGIKYWEFSFNYEEKDSFCKKIIYIIWFYVTHWWNEKKGKVEISLFKASKLYSEFIWIF